MKFTPTLLVVAMAFTLTACSSDDDDQRETPPDNTPDNPMEPDPDAPGEPTDPDNPDNPDNTDNPDNSDDPDNPDNPDNPVNPDLPDNPDTPVTPPGVAQPNDAQALRNAMVNGTSTETRETVWRCTAAPGTVLEPGQVQQYTIAWFNNDEGFYRNNVTQVGQAGARFTWMATSSTQLDYTYAGDPNLYAFSQITFTDDNELSTVVTRNGAEVIDNRNCVKFTTTGNPVNEDTPPANDPAPNPITPVDPPPADPALPEDPIVPGDLEQPEAPAQP